MRWNIANTAKGLLFLYNLPEFNPYLTLHFCEGKQYIKTVFDGISQAKNIPKTEVISEFHVHACLCLKGDNSWHEGGLAQTHRVL